MLSEDVSKMHTTRPDCQISTKKETSPNTSLIESFVADGVPSESPNASMKDPKLSPSLELTWGSFASSAGSMKHCDR